MGISPASKRASGYKYPPLSANFSMPYPLTVRSVQNSAPAASGIYEFRLNGQEIEYQNGKSQLVYTGSTKNIKKRLRDHLGKNNKNGRIREFLKKFNCSYRYIQFFKNWKGEEGKLYNLFVSTYGASPKCNRVSPVRNRISNGANQTANFCK
ncbi:GIY-YIG nuclease family protein [bacterium]|nr:GIY-YIG nuclease family protein [bacterium]